MPVKLALKNILSRRSSVFIILFMSFAAALLTVTNSIFDSTEQGIAKSFMDSFTGDFIIRPIADVPYSLFGDETPVTGNLTDIERLVPYAKISETIENHKDVVKKIPQLSGYAMMEFNRKRYPMSLFGVNAKDYISAMTAISISSGKCYENEERGVMLSNSVATKIGANVGDMIKFTVSDGVSANIRAIPVFAIYDYTAQNSIFEKFVLVDPNTFRSLFDVAEYDEKEIEIKAEQIDLFTDSFDIDSLFSDSEDFSEQENSVLDNGDTSIKFSAINATPKHSDNLLVEERINNEIDGTTWNFLICKVRDSDSISVKRTIFELNRKFRENDWPVEAVNWRYAAGSTAIYLYWLRVILNIGIIIVLSAGFIVVNNTLVINVLDRTREIGTMRAIGASKNFVSLECMSETLIMSIFAWFVGIILGIAISFFLTSAHITFSNEFLIQLFGGNDFVINVSLKNAIQIFMFMVSLGILGWIYPVSTALKLSPLNAMHGIDWVHGGWR